MNVLLDFDGTCVYHEFPKIGRDIGAVPVLKRLIASGHRIILFTMRSRGTSNIEDTLTPAIEWFRSNGIKLYSTSLAPGQWKWTKSIKPYGNLIIDDTCAGIPTIKTSERPYVDWSALEMWLENEGWFNN